MMGFVASTTRSIEKVEREKKRNAGVGVVIKAIHDAKPSEKGVTRLRPIIAVRWDKKAGRYRYTPRMTTITGRPLGGKYAPAPENAPANRKKGYKKKRPGK